MAQNLPASQNHRSAPAHARMLDPMRSTSGFPGIRAAAAPRLMLGVFVLIAAVILSCTVLVVRPASAQAATYTIPSVDISAQAETDGSLHVVDQRTFSFDGACTVVKWTFSGLPSGSEISINSVRMASLGGEGATAGYPQVLGSVPFVLSWRDGGGPSGDCYSYDRARNTVYVFFGASDGSRLIELDYTVANGVTAYADVAEVNWRFVDSQWGADSENVTMTLSLPVPSGASVVPGDNVRAWGHGPADGVVEVDDAGGIAYAIPCVASDSFAEARVVFPADWLTNLPSGTVQPHRTEMRLSTVLSEESAWVDQANRAYSLSLAYIVGCALVCAAALLIGLVAYLRYGREHEPSFKGAYWRALPCADTHPAVIGRLWRWNHHSADDFVATTMRLCGLGAISIGKAPSSEGEGVAPAGGYVLTRLPGARAAASDPLDAAALGLLFDEIAEGGDEVRFSQIAGFARQNPQRFGEVMRAWQKLLTDEAAKRAFFERKSRVWQVRVFVLAGIAALASFAAWSASGSLAPAVFGVLTVVCLVLLGNYLPRRSVEGNEICARCKALRNWLRDLAALDEPLPADGVRWDELLMYAYLFGVSDEALRGLKEKQPQFADAARADAPSHAWLAWYEGDPVAGAVALRDAVSRPSVRRDGV